MVEKVRPGIIPEMNMDCDDDSANTEAVCQSNTASKNAEAPHQDETVRQVEGIRQTLQSHGFIMHPNIVAEEASAINYFGEGSTKDYL